MTKKRLTLQEITVIWVLPFLFFFGLHIQTFWSYSSSTMINHNGQSRKSACQISDSTTSYGSYSGAVPNEKITWGKLEEDTPKFIIESDATIVAPLIFAHVLGW